MSYQSPIEVIYNDIEHSFEDAVFKAIQKVDIKVDRNELIKALEYDRGQYDKGYSDGRLDRDKEIVRCGECEYGDLCSIREAADFGGDGYCAKGERREDG